MNRRRVGLIWLATAAAIAMVPPAQNQPDGWVHRIFIGCWASGMLLLAWTFLFRLDTARAILDGLFSLRESFSLNWMERDAYAMSDMHLRVYGVLSVTVVAWSLYQLYVG